MGRSRSTIRGVEEEGWVGCVKGSEAVDLAGLVLWGGEGKSQAEQIGLTMYVTFYLIALYFMNICSEARVPRYFIIRNEI